jgi:hypothetical protein
MPRYADDVLSGPLPTRRRAVRELAADAGLVVETADGRFCGAVVATGKDLVAGEKRATVSLEDRHGSVRVFPMLPAAFLVDGIPATLVPPERAARATTAPAKTASGSFSVGGAPARVARASRIWVEGIHDAGLVERVWGDDLRVEGVVVEPLNGIDDLAAAVRGFRPGRGRRVGVLVDHLVAGSKETRIAAAVRDPNVLITGHPYVDIWQAVKPSALGIDRWPTIPRGMNWKDGVCAALGVAEPRDMWRRVLASVDSYSDVEVPLIRSVEELIDFVTLPE